MRKIAIISAVVAAAGVCGFLAWKKLKSILWYDEDEDDWDFNELENDPECE